MLKEDVLQKIATSLDPDEIIDRLGMTSEALCELIGDKILDNLSEFDDVIEEDVDGED